jgi:hypothetical protein
MALLGVHVPTLHGSRCLHLRGLPLPIVGRHPCRPVSQVRIVAVARQGAVPKEARLALVAPSARSIHHLFEVGKAESVVLGCMRERARLVGADSIVHPSSAERLEGSVYADDFLHLLLRDPCAILLVSATAAPASSATSSPRAPAPTPTLSAIRVGPIGATPATPLLPLVPSLIVLVSMRLSHDENARTNRVSLRNPLEGASTKSGDKLPRHIACIMGNQREVEVARACV